MEHSNISWNLTDHSVVENQLLFLQSNSEESMFVTTLKEIWPEKDIADLLPENKVQPEEFFALVDDCKEKWVSYKILCDTQEVNNFLIGLVAPLKLSPFANLLKLIKSKIDLSGFTKHLSKVASELNSGTPDLSNRLSEIFLVGKSISLDGKLPFTVTDTQAVTLLESNPANKFTDLLLCVIMASKKSKASTF